MYRILIILAVVAVFCSAAHAGPITFSGPYAPEYWTVTGPVAALISASGPADQLQFHYDTRAFSANWSFSTTAAESGPVTFDWSYSGLHSWSIAKAYLRVFADTSAGRVTTTLFDAGTWDYFSVSGSATMNVESGQAFGFLVGGRNSDSSKILAGDVTIANVTIANPVPEPTSLLISTGGMLALLAAVRFHKSVPK